VDKATWQVRLLAVLFAVSGTGAVLVVAAAAVTALELTGSPGLSTLPVAFSLLGGMVATVPISHLMARRGRRVGFMLATGIAFVGALTAVVAIHRGNFVLFCAGSALIGVQTGVGQLYRFAAVEVSPRERHARAIGIVLAGGVVAGLAGPLLAQAAKDFTSAAFAGCYLALALLQITVLLILPFLEVPLPPPVVKGSGRPLKVIARDPRFAAAVLAGLAAYGAMVVTMVAAPLSLRTQGEPFSAIALVIQAHVVAMYLPSFVSGPLVGRIGPGRGMALGIVGLAACGAVNLAGSSVTHHYVALVLLGVGWNLLFVSATALLTTVYTAAEKATVQGVNDVLLSAMSAAAAFTSGSVHHVHGWAGLNRDVLIGLALATAALLVLMRARPAPAPTPVAS
jgi:MFS family permease